MRLLVSNVKDTLAQQGLNPSEDIGFFLTDIVPTWYSWYYDEQNDILSVDFNVVLSSRVHELGTVIDNGYIIG